ncbi:MAG TPA: VWA domain-containing protein [Gammaproteobacteria bacterium]|nr:VWA domain-containing protein [Gammaproteobacteria bacterium]
MKRRFCTASAAIIGALLMSLLLVRPALAQSSSPDAAAVGVDAVLVIDSSGSMAKNDPDKLRVPAAKLFMSLLGQGDRLGLISFSDQGYPVLHLTAPGPKTQARILAAADRVSSRGVYTNLHAALEKGLDMLSREGDRRHQPMLILMSDGKMDVGDADEDWKLTDGLRKDLIPRAKKAGVKVYTIAFTGSSDVELLRQVASETGGLFKLARSDQDLHEVFSAIFETSKQPDMLPIEGGEFQVDEAIQEVTIVASKEREDVRIFLQSPDGTRLSSEDAGDDIKWFLSSHFDMITLQKPRPGTWKLLQTAGRNRAYIVTDMRLNHNPQNPNLKLNEEVVLETWLEEDGKLLDREAVLTNTRFFMDIRVPSGETARFELFDQGRDGDRQAADGRYSTVLAYEHPGAYEVDLVAESATFKRQKSVHFEVEAPKTPELPAEAAATPPAVAAPTPVADAETARPEPEQKQEVPATGPEDEAEPAEEDTAAQADADQAESAPDEKPAQKKPGLGLILGIFFGINLLLGGLGFGIWWFLKKRKAAAGASGDDAEEKEEEED